LKLDINKIFILPLGQVGNPLNVGEEQGCICAARSMIFLR